jgi:hypothetical protein
MTIQVLEHDGLFTAYRLIIKRRENGTLSQCVRQIEIPLPPPNIEIKRWSKSLDQDQLEVALQIFYDKWNFNGLSIYHNIYTELCNEREKRNKRMVINIPSGKKQI